MTDQLATTHRQVTQVFQAAHLLEGAGFEVRRAIPAQRPRLEAVGPFIFLDHFGPVDFAPGAAKGAPDHPHRGFETLTYVLEGGGMRHRDSLGNVSTTCPGGAQWMRAGRGIVHDESPNQALLRDGGRVHGVQLWINLPRGRKMSPPAYRAIAADDIPQLALQDRALRIRLLAGELEGVKGPIDTFAAPWLAHITLVPGAVATITMPPGYEAGAYILSGAGRLGGNAQPAQEGEMAVFDADGDVLLQANVGQALDLLLLGGPALDAPIVRYGPFVMNTEQELQQAVRDYQRGLMGTIDHSAQDGG